MINYFKHIVKLSKIQYEQINFEPYLELIKIKDLNARFYIGTGQARKWYGNLNKYSILEYEWVLSNINLRNQNIVDGGAHHGHYSVVFVAGSENTCNLISVDPIPMNCLLTEINLRLNDYEPNIEECAIATRNGQVRFEDISNGRILNKGGIIVPAKKLESILPDADIIKLDIEGAEFDVIPDSIEKLENVRTWIIEVHPTKFHKPDELIEVFPQCGFQVLWVNRERNCVETYKPGSEWEFHHTTIFAVK